MFAFVAVKWKKGKYWIVICCMFVYFFIWTIFLDRYHTCVISQVDFLSTWKVNGIFIDFWSWLYLSILLCALSIFYMTIVLILEHTFVWFKITFCFEWMESWLKELLYIHALLCVLRYMLVLFLSYCFMKTRVIVVVCFKLFQFFGSVVKLISFHSYWFMRDLIFIFISGCFQIFSWFSAAVKAYWKYWS